MVRDRNEDSGKGPKQGVEDLRQNLIKSMVEHPMTSPAESDPLRRLVAGDHHAGKARLPGDGGTDHNIQRIPRVMDLYRFVPGIVLGLYIGFPRLNQLRFISTSQVLRSPVMGGHRGRL